MEIQSAASQTSAIQAYTVQQQSRRQNQQSGEITRDEAEAARSAEQFGERVTLSSEARDIAVQKADQIQRDDEAKRVGAQENERQDQERARADNAPRSITRALEAYSQTSLV